MKIVSPDITHKTDVGGVRLDLATPDDVHEAFTAMIDEVRRRVPNACIDGVLVQRMVKGWPRDDRRIVTRESPVRPARDVWARGGSRGGVARRGCSG
jgi:acyl-CoA synthetase (NDP forming)